MMKRIIKSPFYLSLIMAFICNFAFNITAFAASSDDRVGTVSEDGLSVYVDLGELGSGYLQPDEEGNFNGELKAAITATTITCRMFGYTDDIRNKYTIIIEWNGENQVNYIKADKLTIASTSFLRPETYWSDKISCNAHSTKKGTARVGTVVIHPDVDEVKITSSGLQCYFNDRDYWFRLNEINGILDL